MIIFRAEEKAAVVTKLNVEIGHNVRDNMKW